jgi:ABC-type multidrug transport system ATPase subunit
MKKEILLETKNLCKSYGKRKIIEDINIKVERGDIYGFLGPNGSGKTTTIRTILNLIQSDSGLVSVAGLDMNKEFEKAILNVGAIVETPMFYNYLSGKDNLKLTAMLYNSITEKRIEEVLGMVGLSSRAKDKVKTYSLGMKQRLGIARALLHSPSLVILDEPTNGLDPQGMKEVREMISSLAAEKGITFFISTHLLNEVEQICNKVGILKDGRMIAQGNVKELLAEDIETIEIYTKDIKKTEVVIKNIDFVRDAEVTANGIKCRIDRGYSSELNRILVSREVFVNYIVPRSQSLEQYFFELMKGGNKSA